VCGDFHDGASCESRGRAKHSTQRRKVLHGSYIMQVARVAPEKPVPAGLPPSSSGVCWGASMDTLSGAQTIERVRGLCDQTIIAFSTGKDAVAAWLAIRDSFDAVHPYYLYLVPGLEFVEESLVYYEQFFGVKIRRLPHPSLHRWLNTYTFQAPERLRVIDQANLPMHDYRDIRQVMIEDLGLNEQTLVADGVRAADSPMRRIAIKTHGPISLAQGRYHPVWDWLKADLVACFQKSGVKLPVDYNLFGRSFDGIDLRFVLPLKKHRPGDYRKILEWFPLVELEVFRWEHAHG